MSCVGNDTVILCFGNPTCWNCDDSSWWYREEAPIYNELGNTFCSVECADEYDRRREEES